MKIVFFMAALFIASAVSAQTPSRWNDETRRAIAREADTICVLRYSSSDDVRTLCDAIDMIEEFTRLRFQRCTNELEDAREGEDTAVGWMRSLERSIGSYRDALDSCRTELRLSGQNQGAQNPTGTTQTTRPQVAQPSSASQAPRVFRQGRCGSLGGMWYVENTDTGRPVRITLQETRTHNGQTSRPQRTVTLPAGERRRLDCSNTAMGSHSGGGFLQITFSVQGVEFL